MKEKRCKLIFEIYAAVLTLAVAFWVYRSGGFYINNDDYVMRNIISGIYTGTPDAHGIFILYPLSFLLKTLYVFFPQVPWYGLFMIVLHFLCIYLIERRTGYLFETKIKSCITMSVLMIVIIFADYKYMVTNEFTVMSGILATTAVFLIATEKEQKVGKSIVIVLLLTFSMWYRFRLFEMACPFLCIAYVLRIIPFWGKRDKFYKCLKYICIEVAVLAILASSSKAVNNAVYSEPEWKEYLSYNSARAAAFDYGLELTYEQYSAVVEKPVSEAEFEGIQNYAYVMMENVSKEKLLEIVQLSKANKESGKEYYSVSRKLILDTTENFFDLFSSFSGVAMLCSFAIAFALCALKNRKALLALSLVTFCFVWGCLGYCVYKERVILRVTDSLVLLALAVFWLIIVECTKEEKTSIFTKAMGILLLGFLLIFVGLFQRREIKNCMKDVSERDYYWQLICDETTKNPDNIYLIEYSLNPVACSALDEAKDVSSNQFLVTTWLVNSPIMKTQKELNGVDNMREELFSNRNLRLISYAARDMNWLMKLSEENLLECREWNVPGTVEYSLKQNY